MTKKGFSIAETLITMAIIGIVAAITMPVLMNYMQGSYITQAQKNYYDVLKLFRSIESELGTYETWPSMNTASFCNDYISPRLHYVDSSIKSSAKDLYPPAKVQYGSYCIYKLQSGAVYLLISADRAGEMMINFDVNGAADPNIIGVDVHQMLLITDPVLAESDFYKSKGLPFGLNPMSAGLSSEAIKSGCSRRTIDSSNGHTALYVPYNYGRVHSCLAHLVGTGWKRGTYPIKQWGK